MVFTEFNFCNSEMAVEELCGVLKQLLDQLKYPRRKSILKLLSPGQRRTFEELRIETGFSAGSLHHHLSKLCGAGLILITSDWPRRYERSPFFDRLISSVQDKPMMDTTPEAAENLMSFKSLWEEEENAW